MMIEVSKNWHESHPGAAWGVLTMRNTYSPEISPLLEEKRAVLERRLRERYQGMGRKDFLHVPELAAYATYYKRFKKTYHLLLQLESVTQKDKPIPTGVPLVQTMFMAELKSLLLTAGHDLDQIRGPIILDSAIGDESYTVLRGDEVTCKSGDMITSDSKGVFCSVVYGQDQRTRITRSTKNVIYVVYVPSGIPVEVIENHLSELEENVRLINPPAETGFHQIFPAKPSDAEEN
jgi:DNA/RNA-binding domain of Phe-tRNA-synthetase-like protein